jgi:hypothetical protein
MIERMQGLSAMVKEVPMTQQITRHDPMVTDIRPAEAIDGALLRAQLIGMHRRLA